MGRKKIEIEPIIDDRVRRVCFKKRRIGLFKKALQLSKLTNCTIEMKVYNQEDNSLVEYYSESVDGLDEMKPETKYVTEFSRFYNRNYEIVANLEEKLTKNSGLNQNQTEDKKILSEVEQNLEGYNMLSLFSLAKIKS